MCYNLAVRETLASKSNYTAEWLIASFRTYLVTSEVTTIVSLQGGQDGFLDTVEIWEISYVSL